MDNLRKIDRLNVGQEIYVVPECVCVHCTEHWAGWRNADAVQCHGTMIARRVNGIWRDAEGDRVDRTKARKYGSMRSVGISTR